MDIFLPRSEILRQVRSNLGMASSEVIATQVGDQHLGFVQNAAREVAIQCRWVTLRDEVTIDIGEEAQFVNYPENAGPGSIEGMAVWDPIAQDYYPMQARVIPVHASLDQLAEIGGGTYEKGQGRPKYYEQLKQLRVWPATDKAYKLRIRYQKPVEMPTDDTVSIVDAMAIIYLATSFALEPLGDRDGADRFSKRADKRIAQLRGWHQGNLDIQLNADADMGEDEHINISRPRWDDRPTVRPGMSVQ